MMSKGAKKLEVLAAIGLGGPFARFRIGDASGAGETSVIAQRILMAGLVDLLQIARTNQFPIQFFWMQDILLVESPGKKEDARADDDDNQFNEGKKNAFTFHRVPFPFHSPFRHFELDSSLRLIGSVEDTPFRFCFNRLKNQPMKQTESPAKKAKRTSKNERD